MLSDNDKQRIEQEAETRYPFRHLQQTVFKGAAEYATLYERQQFEQERKDAYSAGLMCERILAKDEIERLKTQRAELISLLREYVNDTGAVQTNRKARAEQLLNSLKTK